MGNHADSEMVFKHLRPLGGPVPRSPGRREAEMVWRKELVEASKCADGSPPAPKEQAELKYAVELDFFVTSAGIDLDNLTKPILDTLFSPGPDNPNQAPWLEVTGKVFPKAHDSRVFELVQRKTLVSESDRQGVKITVSWSRA